MDSLYVFGFGAEVGPEPVHEYISIEPSSSHISSGKGGDLHVITLVLKHDPCDLVPYEISGLVRIVTLHQEVILQRPFLYRQHEVAPCLHCTIAGGAAPHFDGVGEEGIFRGGFFVFSVAAVEESFGPGVPMVPVKGAKDGEIGIRGGGVGGIADKGGDPVCRRGNMGTLVLRMICERAWNIGAR